MPARIAIGLLAALLWAGLQARSALTVVRPQCESAVDPLGIDEARPRLSWRLTSPERAQVQTAWQIRAARSLDQLLRGEADLWDSGKVAGGETLHVPYGGAELRSAQAVYWQVRSWDGRDQASEWSEPATWTMGMLSPGDWSARWMRSPDPGPNPLFRLEFRVKPGVRRALVQVCGLGHYELRLNGAKVGGDVLSPGWTQYRTTTLYDTREVTPFLQPGKNVVGVVLGPGMYQVERTGGRFAKFVGNFGPLRTLLQLRVEYEDGTMETVNSGPGWRTHSGPIVFSSIYGGEDYDARLHPAGWDRPGYDDRDWNDVMVMDDASLATLRGHGRAAEPIQPIETRAPVRVRDLSPGVVLYDFGQNASFMPRLRVSGPAGSVVRMTPGEVVNADGTIHRGTMGGADRGSAWWQYTKAGDGVEEWFPQFYYIGSRYLYTELLPANASPAPSLRPRIESLEMVIVHSTARPVGHFAASDPELGRIRQLVRWAQRSNMMSILTDCPHREKLGWLEQNHLNGPSLRYEFDLARLATKNVHDMADSQTAEGLIPNIAPEYTVFKGHFRAAAEWGASFIHVPWQQYLFTADRRLLERHYDAMKRYFSYLEARTQNGVLSEGLGDWYDHVLGKPGRANLTPPAITATAFLQQNAVILARIAALLGHPEDEQRFRRRGDETRDAFRRTWVDLDRPEKVGSGSQTSLAIALAMDLLNPEQRPDVLTALLRDLETRGHATSGAAGFRSLLQALVQAGRSDVIYWLATQTDKPGYAFQLRNGGTTLAESWPAQTGASQNHFFLGQIIEWFYQDLVGIAPEPDAPGFKRVVIRPQCIARLDWAEASYDSVRGPIHVRWERRRPGLHVEIEVPANTEATVYLPARVQTPVREGGEAVESRPEIRVLRKEADHQVLLVPSGRYRFESLP